MLRTYKYIGAYNNSLFIPNFCHSLVKCFKNT